MSGLTFLDVYFIQRATTLRRLSTANNPMTLHQDNLILGGQRSGKDENGIPDYNDGGSDMDLLMLSAGILDVLEALPYTRATFGTCVGSSLCQCNLHLSADYVDQEPGCIMHQCCFLMTTAMPNAPSPETLDGPCFSLLFAFLDCKKSCGCALYFPVTFSATHI
ncbi:uncharacterized protein [Triticum aestivum]|uniref:uncharacterized protein isoform X3 n=1 Tax=Triticum aestivum TaxID=4565 RepID=UPI001D0240FC|nr:uncharacterized protein LOC123043746 isoform X3 [Triticum aestivum]